MSLSLSDYLNKMWLFKSFFFFIEEFKSYLYIHLTQTRIDSKEHVMYGLFISLLLKYCVHIFMRVYLRK